MWKAIPEISISAKDELLRNKSFTSGKGIPNLSPRPPVEIFLWVSPIISGLILILTCCLIFRLLAMLLILCNSLTDSALIWNILFEIANSISSSVFPTPENTISLGLIPASKDFFNSPTDTTSAPAPSLFNNFKIDKLELDLVE